MAKKAKVQKKKASNGAAGGCLLLIVLWLGISWWIGSFDRSGEPATAVATVRGSESSDVITPLGESFVPQAAMTEEVDADGRLFAQMEVEIYSCPETTCVVMGQLVRGQAVAPIRVEGDFVVVAARGGEGYVLAELVAETRPGAAELVATGVPTLPLALPLAMPFTAPAERATSRPAAAPRTSIRPATGWVCGQDLYNCTSFQARADMEDYFRTCAGDPSRLDQGGVEGVPCENESYPDD
jgi:hypothetical protein